MLEASHTSENLDWDVLVGAENIRVNNKVEMKVKKRGKNAEAKYVFDPYVDSPLQFSSRIEIQDRFTDAREFQKIIDLSRYYLALPLDEIPIIPTYANDRRIRQERDFSLQNPMDDIYNINITPTHLGETAPNGRHLFSGPIPEGSHPKTTVSNPSGHGIGLWDGLDVLVTKIPQRALVLDDATSRCHHYSTS